MKTADYNDMTHLEAIEHAVYGPTNVSMNNREAFWIVCDNPHDSVHSLKKLFSQPFTFSFVPPVCRLGFRLGDRPSDNWQAHF